MPDQLPRYGEPEAGFPAHALPAHALPAPRPEPLAVPAGRLIAILRRHLWVVLFCPLVIVTAAFAVLRQMPRQYTAEASILIEPQRTQVSDLQAISPDSGDVAGLLRTQIDILRSPALTLQVVQALHLTQRPEFQPHGGLAARIGDLLQRFGLRRAQPEPPLSPQQMAERVALILNDKISFVNEVRSSVLRVAVTTEDARQSADIANKFAEVFLNFKRQEKFEAMQRAHDWFQEQMGKLAEQLRADGLAVEQYRLAHRLDDQPPDDGTATRTPSINRQQLDTLSNQMMQVSRERALKEGQLAQAEAVIRGQAVGGALPAVLASPVIVELVGQIATATGREAQLASAQGIGNPDLVAARAQLHRLQARLQSEMVNISNSLRADVRAAQLQEKALQDQLGRLRLAVSDENAAQVPLQVLQTKERATRSIYESFLVRATQLANVAGIQEPDASLVSSAQAPLGPSGPQVKRLLVVAGGLALALGVGLACALEQLSQGFTSPEQVEATLGLPLHGLIPKMPRRVLRRLSAHGAIVRGASPSADAAAAALDNLRGRLRALGEARPKLVMITSAVPQEGKSIFAAELARNAAAAGWRVMLIECDLYCPSLAAHFRTAAGPGLCDILAGRLLGDIARVVHEPAPRLHVITAGRPVSDTQELLASGRMTALLAAVRARYDLVVLDTPPVLPVADALVLARHAEATLMVVRWDSTARHAVQDAMRQLHEYRARLLGVIMTQVDMRRAARAAGRMAYAFSFNGTYYGRPVGGQRLVMQGGALGRALILLTAGLLRARGAGRPVARG